MLMDLFCEWFEGYFNNQEQAYNRPREAAYVTARHRRTYSNQFHCTYYRSKCKTPYREVFFDIINNDGEVILRSPSASLHFKVVHGSFVCQAEHTLNGKRYSFQATLTEHGYFLNDQCYSTTGELERGLEDGSFYEFKRIR